MSFKDTCANVRSLKSRREHVKIRSRASAVIRLHSSALATEMISNLRSSSVTCTSRRGDFSRFINHLCVSWAFSCGRGPNRSSDRRCLFRATDNGLIFLNIYFPFVLVTLLILFVIPFGCVWYSSPVV